MDPKRKSVVVFGVTVAGLVAVVFGAIVAIITSWHCTGGDGGAPYVARDSPQADVCGATGDGAGLTGLLILAALGLLVVVWRLGRAWAQRTRGAAPFATTAVCVALLPALPIGMFTPFSAECTGESERAYDAWIDGGRQGEAPADCESF